MSENLMRKIGVEKVTLNVGAGEAGPKLDSSVKMIQKIANSKTVITRTHKRTAFGGAKGRPIGAKTTLRGKKAIEILNLLLQVKEHKINANQFDKNGNFSFGIAEYINIPGIKYDPDIGILGFDIAVTLQRPGFRIKRKVIKSKKIGVKHRITKEEAIDFVKKEFKVQVM